MCGASAAVQQRLLFNVRLEDAGPGVGIDRENYGRNSARITKKNHSDRRNERFGVLKKNRIKALLKRSNMDIGPSVAKIFFISLTCKVLAKLGSCEYIFFRFEKSLYSFF